MTAATNGRWRPARAGIRNVWEYDDQIFAFADGRLILRGPNGSGKSNALALLFPFLIDGTMSAAAMDPFAGGRSMRSLLLGVVKDDDARAGRFRHDQRLGYVWLELERSDGDGLRHLTVGCGARATAQRDATSWFFVTDRRVGAELDLAPDGEPLSRARLIQALGADAVTDTAEDHRAAVDRALYGFGADRHRKLVGLIRVLRRPQLAGKLDPDLLSTVLSEGLAALGASVLDDVAASLDDLEATQRELEELRATRAVVDTFLPVYHRYLVAEAAERAGATQAAVERRGRSQRDRRAAWAEVEASEAALAANTDARQATDEVGRAADAQRVAVIESPAYRDATSLREVTAAAARAEEAEAGARRRRDEAESAAQAAHEEAAAATATAAAALVTADRALTAVLDAADRADAPWTLSADDAADPERLESGARVVERARRDDVREVRQALDARQVAGRDHAHAEAAASAALAAADTATLEAQEAGEALDAARARLRHAVAGWVASAPGLDASGRAELVDAIDRVGTVGDAGPAVRYRALVAPEREALAAAAARSEDRTRALAEQTTALEVERDRIASEADPGPEPPAWRRADRSDRPGAPLWACCDFAPALGARDGAGLEAALAAAGLLDAWVAPEDEAPGSRPGEAPGAGGSATDKGRGKAEAGIGRADGAGSGPSDGAGIGRADGAGSGPDDGADRVSPPERSPGAPALTAAAADPDAGSGRDPGGGEDPDGGSPARVEGVDPGDATLDSWLVAGPVENPGDGADGGARHLSDGPTLTDVLVALPPEGSGLTEDRIIEVLDGVGLGRLGVAVAADGRFTLGPLRGRAGQDAAQFIGATARAERRRRRLAEIDRELADVAERVQGERAEAERIAAAGAALDQAEADVPSTQEVEEAQAAATAAGSRAEAERAVADRAAAAEAEAAAVLGQRSRTLTEVAARRRLDPSAEALDEVGELLGVLSRAASQAVGARRTAVDRAAQAAREGARAEAAARLGADRNAEWAEASGEAVSLRSRADTLHEQVGAEAEAAVARLAQAEATLDASRIEGRRLADVRADLSEAHGRARRSVESAEAAVADAETSVATCGARLDVLRRRDLLAVLVPEALPSPVTDDHGGVDPGDVDGIDEIGPADPLGVDVEPVDVPIGGESPIGGDVPIGGESPADGGLPAAPEDFGAWLADALGSGRPDEAELARTRKALDGAGKRLLDDIHHSYDASIARDDEIAVVEVTSEGGTFPLARLGRELATGQETLEQYLTEGDREVFERYLLNQVSHELRRLLGEAEEFVAGVNQALAGARTASGLAVELRWELGVDDSAVRDAVRLLRRDVTHLGADDLGVLRAFFERIIREQRAERPEAGYRAALEAALDYRSWHQFRPYLRTPTGGSTRLTRATFKQLSGGEQAVSLHLPLFAAAAAHYARAQPTAPRLIALDEAFAGIDEAMRGELMGLTVRFDLDVIMTGHELWGAYAEVPAVAIHDLLRRPPEEGVSVVSLRWDGGALAPADEDVEAGG